MPTSRRLIRLLGATTLSVTAQLASATITVYNTTGAFAAATTSPGLDTFASLPVDIETLPNPLSRAAAPYGYSVAAPGGLFGSGSAADPWLSSKLSADLITFSGFTGGVQAIGGLFFRL